MHSKALKCLVSFQERPIETPSGKTYVICTVLHYCYCCQVSQFAEKSLPRNLAGEPSGEMVACFFKFTQYLADSPSLLGKTALSLSKVSGEMLKYHTWIMSRADI